MKIIKTTNKNHLGILALKDSWLQEIKKLSGELAKDNEYQAHYWALILRKTYDDGSHIDIAFPLVYFNYPQQVSIANVEYESKDMMQASDVTKDLAEYKASELINKLKDFINKYEFNPFIVSKMNFHRHP